MYLLRLVYYNNSLHCEYKCTQKFTNVLTCIFIDHTQLVGLDVFLKVHTQSDSLNMYPKSAHTMGRS